jgi:predicted dehydrogenase
MTTPLRIGMIGCGRIAQAAHLPALAKTDQLTLVSVYDPSELLSSQVAARYGVTSSVTLDDLLATDIDAVVIATPDRFHHQLGMAALSAGKHVLVEKPLAATVAEAEELVVLAAERGLRLQTGAMKRHDPGVSFAHDALPELGRAVSYHSVYRVPARRAPIEATLFPDMIVDDEVRAVENTFKSSGNRTGYLLATHGAHVFDTLIHFTGLPRWIRVHGSQVGEDYTWHGVVGLAEGGVGSFEMTVDAMGRRASSCWPSTAPSAPAHTNRSGSAHRTWRSSSSPKASRVGRTRPTPTRSNCSWRRSLPPSQRVVARARARRMASPWSASSTPPSRAPLQTASSSP